MSAAQAISEKRIFDFIKSARAAKLDIRILRIKRIKYIFFDLTFHNEALSLPIETITRVKSPPRN